MQRAEGLPGGLSFLITTVTDLRSSRENPKSWEVASPKAGNTEFKHWGGALDGWGGGRWLSMHRKAYSQSVLFSSDYTTGKSLLD